VDPDRVRQLLEPTLGIPDEMRPGGDHDYPCPFCVKSGRARISHLHVNYSKGKALCHGCGAKFASLRSLILALLGRIPKSLRVEDGGAEFETYVEALLFGKGEDRETAVHRPALPEGFVPLVPKPGDRAGRITARYLCEERKVPFARLAEVGAGYCTDGAMRGYAIFPVHIGGRLVTYTSRRVPTLRLGGPKAKHGRFGRSASMALFNYDNCEGVRRLFLGEGPFDAWAFHRRLRPDDCGVSALGTVLHRRHIRLIEALDPEEVVVCFDPDATDKAVKAAETLSSVGLRASYMEVSADPDELDEQLLRDCVRYRQVADPELGAVHSWGTNRG